MPKAALAVVVSAAWFGCLYLIDIIGGNGDVQGAVFFVLTLAAALIAGTWWILIAPWLASAVILAYDKLNPCDDCYDELGFAGSAFLMALISLGVDAVLAAGVGIRKGATLLRKRRAGTTQPPRPAT